MRNHRCGAKEWLFIENFLAAYMYFISGNKKVIEDSKNGLF